MSHLFASNAAFEKTIFPFSMRRMKIMLPIYMYQ